MASHVEFSGPYFDARYDAYGDQLNHDLEDAVAQQAMANWHGYLDTSLRFPTGFYESHVRMQSSPSGAGGTVVSDQGVIYGPLAGGRRLHELPADPLSRLLVGPSRHGADRSARWSGWHRNRSTSSWRRVND
jgi:hypothetical protein